MNVVMFGLFALFAKQISVELFKITNVPPDFFYRRQKKSGGGAIAGPASAGPAIAVYFRAIPSYLATAY